MLVIKKILLVLLIIPVLLFCGFKKLERPFVVLSSSEIHDVNVKRIERDFGSGYRIYYALVMPNGLKYSGVRLQVSSLSDKVSNWGFSLVETRDLYIPRTDRIYKDYFIAKKPGRYVLQFFYLNKKNHPFAHIEFRVM